MLVGLLLGGILVGALAAAAGLIAGFSLWAALGLYVLGGILGVLATAPVFLLHRQYRLRRSRRAARLSPGSPSEPKSLSTRG